MATQAQAFRDLEKHEPGVWSLAQGHNPFLEQRGYREAGNGALIELYAAIPVPDNDVPLNDILEFRLRGRDELLLLTTEIENLSSGLEEGSNTQAELQSRIEKVE